MKITAAVSLALFSTLLYSMEKQQNTAAPAFPKINVSAIQKFLDEGGDPNIEDDGYNLLFLALAFEDIECAKLLLNNNANPNVLNRLIHETPFHKAVTTGNIVLVQLLLDYNANPDIQDRDGNTPLHDIFLIPRGIDGKPICKLLIEHTKNPFIKNKYGVSPYTLAPEKYKHLLTKESIEQIKQERLIKIKKESKLQKLQIEHTRLETFLVNHPITLSPANLAALQSIRREQVKKSICLIS